MYLPKKKLLVKNKKLLYNGATGISDEEIKKAQRRCSQV